MYHWERKYTSCPNHSSGQIWKSHKNEEGFLYNREKVRIINGSEKMDSVAQCGWPKESATKMTSGTTTEDVLRVTGSVKWH